MEVIDLEFRTNDAKAFQSWAQYQPPGTVLRTHLHSTQDDTSAREEKTTRFGSPPSEQGPSLGEFLYLYPECTGASTNQQQVECTNANEVIAASGWVGEEYLD